jgi:hypothetical protein
MNGKILLAGIIAALIAGCSQGICAEQFTGYTTGFSATSLAQGNTPKSVVNPCPPGRKVLGGGAAVVYLQDNKDVTDPDGLIIASEPTPDFSGWHAIGIERTPSDRAWAVRAYAICAKVYEGPPK